MDVLDRGGVGDRQDVGAAFQRVRVIAEPLAAPQLFVREAQALHHRPHRAIEDDDAAGQQITEGVDGGHPPLITTLYSMTGTSELTPAPANEIGWCVDGSVNVANSVDAPVVGSIVTTLPVPSCVNPNTWPLANDVPNSFG